MQSWSTCSLSGEQIETPVVSKLSGHLFEKRLIEKHIESTGTCPITGRVMSLEDIVPVKVHPVQKPRPLTATSVPQMLGLLQNEWDTLLLEQFQLKSHLETVRQELTHALYQHDAACRVIARVIKERDQARIELAQLQEKVHSNKGKMEAERDSDRLPEHVVNEVEDMAVKLNNLRKQRRKQQEYIGQFPSAQVLSNFKEQTTTQVKNATCIDINKDHKGIVVVGTQNGNVILQDTKNNKLLSTIEKHKSKITSVNFFYLDEHIRFVTCSEDSTAIFYKYEEVIIYFVLNFQPGKLSQTYDFRASGAIVGCAIHPIQYLVILATRDGTFSFHDAQNNTLLSIVTEFRNQTNFSSVAIHPDGHFAAFGSTDGTIKIWKVSANQLIAQLEGHQNEVEQLAFSETGTILASSSNKEGIVHIWNLRTSEIVKTLFKDHKQKIGITLIRAIAFDDSAQYLAVGCQETIFLFDSKKWDLFSKIQGHTDLITGLKFGNLSRSIITCSLDGKVNLYNE